MGTAQSSCCQPDDGINHCYLWSGHSASGLAARLCLKVFLVAVGCEKELWEWELNSGAWFAAGYAVNIPLNGP